MSATRGLFGTYHTRLAIKASSSSGHGGAPAAGVGLEVRAGERASRRWPEPRRGWCSKAWPAVGTRTGAGRTMDDDGVAKEEEEGEEEGVDAAMVVWS